MPTGPFAPRSTRPEVARGARYETVMTVLQVHWIWFTVTDT
jgi:hypothetical protein